MHRTKSEIILLVGSKYASREGKHHILVLTYVRSCGGARDDACQVNQREMSVQTISAVVHACTNGRIHTKNNSGPWQPECPNTRVNLKDPEVPWPSGLPLQGISRRTATLNAGETRAKTAVCLAT